MCFAQESHPCMSNIVEWNQGGQRGGGCSRPPYFLNKGVFNRQTTNECGGRFWRFPWTHLAQHTRQVERTCRVPCHLNSPSRVRNGDEGVAGRNRRKLCVRDNGSLICPPGISMIFTPPPIFDCLSLPWMKLPELWAAYNIFHPRNMPA